MAVVSPSPVPLESTNEKVAEDSFSRTAPYIKTPYDPNEALDDIPGVAHALELFLNSHMFESEEYCLQSDPKKYFYFWKDFTSPQDTVSYNAVKAFMSYADEDILAGIGHTKQGNLIAMQHRKKAASFTSRLAGYVVTSLNTTGVGFIKSMTPVERHAELVYAESLFEKALLGVVYSGDWLAFIKEALNMRTTINIYRVLYKFITTMDEASPSGYDDSIDVHFRSGVYLGAGMSTLILSLMPSKLLTIIELFGYHGDRAEALSILSKAGGWTSTFDEPSVPVSDEGLRRPICDMALMVFHLVLSSFTFEGVDVQMADKIIRWNARRYPNGVFFLFGAGRLALMRSQPEESIRCYTRAMEIQSQYRNLHHVSFWEIAIARLALWDVKGSLKCWQDLEREATWSKAIYTYGMAVCLLEGGGDPKEAKALMEKVPNLRQKIAGKSIPLEKLVARKARKFLAQGRLALPALEIGYLFLAITHAPREVVAKKMLVEVQECLKELDVKDKKSMGYWDDFCLAKFLEGVCMRYIAYPDPDAIIPPDAPSVVELAGISESDAAKTALSAFEDIFNFGPKIELDHHIVYHSHYELGRLLACQGKEDEARAQFHLVLSGKHLEVGPSGKKGRYSMENALHMRTHAALEALGKRNL